VSFARAADAKETDIAPFLLGLAKVGLLRRQKVSRVAVNRPLRKLFWGKNACANKSNGLALLLKTKQRKIHEYKKHRNKTVKKIHSGSQASVVLNSVLRAIQTNFHNSVQGRIQDLLMGEDSVGENYKRGR